MSVLVIAQHDNANLNPSTLNLIGAGKQLGDVTVLIAGTQCQPVAETVATANGVSAVLLAESESHNGNLAENMADTIARNATEHNGGFDYILFPANTFGKNIAPRVSALLDTQQISDVMGIESADTFIRPIYADNAIATVQSMDSRRVLTLRTTTFDAVELTQKPAPISTGIVGVNVGVSAFGGIEIAKSERPDLTNARVVVSGGRALGSQEKFALIEKLADTLGGAVGASRAAVDSGYAPNDLQVGQTGKIVAPELYIAVGLSGAIQHIAGIKDSKTIVAINTDADAPIFGIADYGLVADLFDVVPELTTALSDT